MTVQDSIRQFLSAGSFAVVGASADPAKFGHRCLAAYLRHGRRVFAVNPRGGQVLGQPCYPDLASLPERPEAVSIVTPPAVTERVMEEVVRLGIRQVWMQPGAESAGAVALGRQAGVEVIAGGPCVLVELDRLAG